MSTRSCYSRYAAAAVAGIVGLASTVVTPSAHAAFGCPATKGNFFDGFVSTPGGSTAIRGVAANITYRNPDLCGSDSSDSGFSAAWTMLKAYSDNSYATGPVRNWAQSGYVQTADNTAFSGTGATYTFEQYTSQCYSWNFQVAECQTPEHIAAAYHTSLQDDPDPSTATTWEYKSVQLSNGHIGMYVNGTKFLETNYDPAGDWSTSWQAQYCGETQHTEDDMPGRLSNNTKTLFEQLAQYTSPTASAPATPGYVVNDYATRWDHDPSVGTDNDFEIWTKS